MLNKKSQGDVLYAQAESAAEEGDIDKACQLLQEALTVYQKDGHEEGMARSWLALAQMETNEMQIDSALMYIDKAIPLQVGDSLHAAILAEKGAEVIYLLKERSDVCSSDLVVMHTMVKTRLWFAAMLP